MKSIQDYRNEYRQIATNLGIVGDSVELLVQMLSQFSYINEVENMSYVKEASIENATLMNSKIQHCVDNMYSVFRGLCPRVILKFKPTKYFSFKRYQEIIKMSNFSVYYLGYFDKREEGSSSIYDGFVESDCSISPSTTDTKIILGLLSPTVITKSWITDSTNRYYVDCTDEEDLSNDMYITDSSSKELTHTREFNEHILNGDIFDLTLPSFSSRLYLAGASKNLEMDSENSEEVAINQMITANYFTYTILDSYNFSELKRLSMQGATLVDFDSSSNNLNEPYIEKFRNNTSRYIGKGIIVLPESARDSLYSMHYKLNKNKFTSSMVRSNNDLETIFEEYFPDYITPGGTYYYFSEPKTLTIVYVEKEEGVYIPQEKIQEFKENRKAYFIASQVNIIPGIAFNIKVDVEIETTSIISDDEKDQLSKNIEKIIKTYENKFNINPSLESQKQEIMTNISKLSNVTCVNSITVTNTSDTEWDGSKNYLNISVNVK